MKQVELVRARVIRGLEGEFNRLRIHLSMFEDGTQFSDRLQGENRIELLANLTDAVLAHLGHNPTAHTRNGGTVLHTGSDSMSKTRRALARG